MTPAEIWTRLHLAYILPLKIFVREKNANNGEFHESLNSLAAILGAGLVGIDKTNQDGYNYVKNGAELFQL